MTLALYTAVAYMLSESAAVTLDRPTRLFSVLGMGGWNGIVVEFWNWDQEVPSSNPGSAKK